MSESGWNGREAKRIIYKYIFIYRYRGKEESINVKYIYNCFPWRKTKQTKLTFKTIIQVNFPEIKEDSIIYIY